MSATLCTDSTQRAAVENARRCVLSGAGLVETAEFVPAVLVTEGQSSAAYFPTIGKVLGELRWSAPGLLSDWRSWDGVRISRLSGKNRRATHPGSALLNFGYAINAALLECTLAVAGFDPAAGYLHTDYEGRASLAWDACELLRSTVDRAVIGWLIDGPGKSRRSGTEPRASRLARRALQPARDRATAARGCAAAGGGQAAPGESG